MRRRLTLLALVALLVSLPVLAGTLEHRLSIGGGGGRFVTGGCNPALVGLGEAGLSYELHFDPEQPHGHGFAGALGHLAHFDFLGGDPAEFNTPGTEIGLAVYGGYWHRWIEVAGGIGISLPTGGVMEWGTRLNPYPVGRIRIFPEQYVYTFFGFADQPVSLVPGSMRMGLGTTALRPFRIELAAAAFPYDIWGFSPSVAVDVIDGVGLRLQGFVSVNDAESDDYDLGRPVVGGLSLGLDLKF